MRIELFGKESGRKQGLVIKTAHHPGLAAVSLLKDEPESVLLDIQGLRALEEAARAVRVELEAAPDRSEGLDTARRIITAIRSDLGI